MFMEGFKDDTRREDIKEVLQEQFGVEASAFAYMDFQKGNMLYFIKVSFSQIVV